MLALLPTLLLLTAQATAAQAEAGTVLHEPKTGVTLTLPDGWEFATGQGRLMALSADQRGFVLLAAAAENFEETILDVKALILKRLDDVVVAKTTVSGVNERGSLEALVAAEGKGMSRRDGEPVEFSALVVKSGDGGALALGAWKDAANAAVVAKILAGLHIKESAGKGGLEVTDAATGVTVTVPTGWEVLRSRKGLMATCPHGSAMVLSLRWQDDFEQSLDRIRTILTGWVFKDIKIGEFAAVEASYDKSVGRVIAASGTAIDRADDRPVEFSALRLQRLDLNEGAALFGVWKDEEHAKEVEQMLASIRIKKKKVEQEK